MRFLVVGAGALGGYFGGRLLEAGHNVTFLLRPRRVAQLAVTGLVIRSPAGDTVLPAPPHLLAGEIGQPFDVVMVGCKAYDLDETIESFAPAVGPDSVVLPLLNGMRHLDTLKDRFGSQRVLGGLCLISAVLDDSGVVMHLNNLHRLVFGELDGTSSVRVDAIAAAFADANFEGIASHEVQQAMWEKWVLIASLAGITSLLRGSIGDIVTAGAQNLALDLFDECSRIAAHNGFAPRPAAVEQGRAAISAAGSPLTASMFKDIERGARTEADHILGDLLSRSNWCPSNGPLLRIAYAHLLTGEARRLREAGSKRP